jgi:serine/threonine protein kinase
LTPTDRTLIALDVARGMEYMHERAIIHRDLKSLNILLDSERRARICDFGLVRLKSLAPMTGLIGTPQWMAPEILMCSIYYDGKVDVFSYGVVLWELLTNELPYPNVPLEKLGYLVVEQHLRPGIPHETPSDLAALITACWAGSPSDRPTFTQIINLLNSTNYHFPGTIEDELWARAGGRRKKTASFSDPVKAIDSEIVRSSRTTAQVDRVMAALKEAVVNSQPLAIDRSLSDLRSLHKANLLVLAPSSCFEELIAIARDACGEYQELILLTIGDFIAHPQIFEKFRAAGGMSLLEQALKASETALSIYVRYVAETAVSLDTIRLLLAFSSHPRQSVRELAVTGLIAIVEKKFEKLRSTPSFVG